MLGDPVAVVAELLDPGGQRGRAVQGLAGGDAAGDGHHVEDREAHGLRAALEVQLAGGDGRQVGGGHQSFSGLGGDQVDGSTRRTMGSKVDMGSFG